MVTNYQYLDYFSQQTRKCRCEVLSTGNKTTTIRLLEFGPNGRRPGSVMRVHNKSLNYTSTATEPDFSWHQWTD